MFHSVIHEEEMTADHRQGRPQQFGPWSSSTLPWAFFPLIVQYLCFLVLSPASPSPLFLLGGQESIIKWQSWKKMKTGTQANGQEDVALLGWVKHLRGQRYSNYHTFLLIGNEIKDTVDDVFRIFLRNLNMWWNTRLTSLKVALCVARTETWV